MTAPLQLLERARWAGRAYARYDVNSVRRIVRAVADAAYEKARDYAVCAVEETGFGIVEHKVRKNEACSRGIAERYAADDYVTPRLDPTAKILHIPRPAGSVLALTPSTNPVSTVYVKTLLSLMTRNAVVISPHPYAKACCADAARTLAKAAVDAGAPDGVVQVVDEPTIPVINALMTDERTDLIVATGGTAVVRAAYSSGNPALGVGPGNVPVLVDATADITQAAQRIADSKSFDNSVLCTNESVLVAERSIVDTLRKAMERAGAYFLSVEETARMRAYLFPGGEFNVESVGKDAAWIAERIGVRVAAKTRILVAPFDAPMPEEPLAHEKLCPVLGLVTVESADRGIDAARAILRIGGAGHSAAIHSTTARTIMDFGARVPVLRVAVNAGNSTGSAGMDTNLALSMTIGTGFVGGSGLGDNLEPRHLVNWTRVAYNVDAPFDDFAGMTPWSAPAGAVPPYPYASNLGEHPAQPVDLKDEIRRLVIEELEAIIGGR